MSAKKYLFALMVVGLLFVSGCAECKKTIDCETRTCFTVKCTDKKCAYNVKEDCCGNGMCEDGTRGTKDFGENKGSCGDDCGICTGETGEYLELVFDEKTKECATGVDDTKVTEENVVDNIDLRFLKLTATYSYSKPFDIDNSLFNVKMKLDSKDDSVSSIRITQIKILETAGRSGTSSIFGEKNINQVLWDSSSVINKGVILSVPVEGTETEKSITLEIYYEFTRTDRGTETVEKGSYKKDLSDKLLFVNPTVSKSCPSNCDDNNICTEDVCSEDTDYFCSNIITLGSSCCGNAVCDSSENECTCREDCGKCERDFGDYMTFICSENDCKSKLKDIEVMQPKTLIEQPNLRDFQFEVKTTFDEPFDIRTSNMLVDIELTNKEDTISGIKCTKYQLLVGDVLLGESVITKSFGSIGSQNSLEVEFDFSMKDVEEEKSPVLKASCEYDKTSGDQTDHVITSFSQNLGNIVFVKTEI